MYGGSGGNTDALWEYSGNLATNHVNKQYSFSINKSLITWSITNKSRAVAPTNHVLLL